MEDTLIYDYYGRSCCPHSYERRNLRNKKELEETVYMMNIKKNKAKNGNAKITIY